MLIGPINSAVRSAAIGEPHLVRVTSRDPAPPPLEYVTTSGGRFLDMTIHDFDMARYLTGIEVVEVYARGALRTEPASRPCTAACARPCPSVTRGRRW